MAHALIRATQRVAPTAVVAQNGAVVPETLDEGGGQLPSFLGDEFNARDVPEMLVLGPESGVIGEGCGEEEAVSHWQFVINGNLRRA